MKYVERMGNNIRVLAVEDNPGDLGLVKDYLFNAEFGQYKIDGIGLVSGALQMLDAGGYDVILLDLNLPDSHGFETFTRIHTKVPQVPIIVLTGSTTRDRRPGHQ